MAFDSPLVLVVDDDRDTRELCMLTLQMSGYRATEADNGQAAIERAHQLHPDVILMDLMLPGMSGVEACEALKRDPATSEIPIVAVSGHTMLTEPNAGGPAGCSIVVTKPYLPEDLVRAIRQALDTRPGSPAAR